MMQSRSNRQIPAWIAIVAVLFVMLFSALYISMHADHDCTGDECPICAEMVLCVNNIKNIGTFVVAVSACVFLVFSFQEIGKCKDAVEFSCSLISQKVRINR